MCRLLGYSSEVETTFDQVVGNNFLQFVALSSDHCDGWGIATSNNLSTALYKEPIAAAKSGSFKEQIAKHKSKSALLHLRWATTGMPVSEVNTHPFTYKDISFIHNGSLTPPDCLDHLLDEKYLALAQGSTDSERYFLYLLTQIDKYGFIEGVKAGLTYIKNNCEYSSINMMITNPDSFITACVYNQDKIPGKFKDDKDYYELKYKYENHQVIFASSGWNQEGWQEIPNGSAVIVDKKNSSLTLFTL